MQNDVDLPMLANGENGGPGQGDLRIGLGFRLWCLAFQRGRSLVILNKFVESVGREPVPSLPKCLARRVGVCSPAFVSS